MKILSTIVLGVALLFGAANVHSDTVCVNEDDQFSIGLGFLDGDLSLGSFLYSNGGISCYETYRVPNSVVIIRDHPYGYVPHRSAHNGRFIREMRGRGYIVRPDHRFRSRVHRDEHPAYLPHYNR